jgi:hypothetical protein
MPWREEILIIRVNSKKIEIPRIPYKVILIKLKEAYRSIKNTLEKKKTTNK